MTDEQILAFVTDDKKSSAQKILNGGAADGMPAIIKIILGLGAFASSCLFFGALGSLAFFGMRNGAAYLTLGLISMGFAIAVKNLLLPKLGPNLKFFLEQCCLVTMLFGRACVFAAAAFWNFWENGFLTVGFFMMAIPYKFFDNFADRFISVFVFAVVVYVKYFALHERGWRMEYVNFEPVILFFFMAAGAIFAARRKIFNPAGWALITSTLIPAAFVLFLARWSGGVDSRLQMHYMDVVFNWQKMVLVVYFGAAFLAYKKFTSGVKHDDYLVFAVLVFALLPFNLPVLYGLFFLLLGRFFNDVKVEILGYATVAGGLIYLYYNLQVSLMTKSLLLMASGLFLFGLRYAARRVYAR